MCKYAGNWKDTDNSLRSISHSVLPEDGPRWPKHVVKYTKSPTTTKIVCCDWQITPLYFMCNRDVMFRINLTLINSKYSVFRLHDVTFTSVRTSGLLLFQQPFNQTFPAFGTPQSTPEQGFSLHCTELKNNHEHPSKGAHKHCNLSFLCCWGTKLKRKRRQVAEVYMVGWGRGIWRQVRMTCEACGGGSCALVQWTLTSRRPACCICQCWRGHKLYKQQ